MSEQRILYLSRADVEAVGVTMAEIIDALEVAFREHGLGTSRCRRSLASIPAPMRSSTRCPPISRPCTPSG